MKSNMWSAATIVEPSERLKQAVQMLYEHVLQHRARSAEAIQKEINKGTLPEKARDNHQATELAVSQHQ